MVSGLQISVEKFEKDRFYQFISTIYRPITVPSLKLQLFLGQKKSVTVTRLGPFTKLST